MSSTSHNNHSVDDHILAQLAPLQSTIFTSFQGGDDALCSFKESWTSFKKTYDTCSSILLDETRTAVESFALLLHTISSALLASELIHEQYEKDIAQLADVEFKKLSINDKPETSVLFSYSLMIFGDTDRFHYSFDTASTIHQVLLYMAVEQPAQSISIQGASRTHCR